MQAGAWFNLQQISIEFIVNFEHQSANPSSEMNTNEEYWLMCDDYTLKYHYIGQYLIKKTTYYLWLFRK